MATVLYLQYASDAYMQSISYFSWYMLSFLSITDQPGLWNILVDVTVTLDYFTSCILKVLLNFTIIVYFTVN